MRERRPVIAIALCVILLFSLFMSSAYIVRETARHHDCVGEGCPICQFIAQVEQLLRGFSALVAAWLLIRLLFAARGEWRAMTLAAAPVPCTLVSRKIRLND